MQLGCAQAFAMPPLWSVPAWIVSLTHGSLRAANQCKLQLVQVYDLPRLGLPMALVSLICLALHRLISISQHSRQLIHRG